MQNRFLAVVCLLFLSEGSGATPWFPPGLGLYDDLGELVTFHLFTRTKNDLSQGEILTLGDQDKLLRSYFNGSLTTILCTHGFLDNMNSSWIINLKRNMLMEENVNFITVDYSLAAKNVLYDEVVRFVKKAGNYIGEFLKFLQAKANVNVEKVHLIGHSLGAQAMSFAAKAFPPKTIGRITGLDPAAPLFENSPESQRLNPNSAKLVDVIHTCVFLLGMKKPVGTIDFYPNGGFNQPFCKPYELSCHHGRSREYFYQSILQNNRDRFVAAKCKTLNNALNGTCNGEPATMGYHLKYSSPGMYYLKIN